MDKKNFVLRKTSAIFRLFIVVILFAAGGSAYGQVDSQKVVPIPQPVPQNAGFDVIVKINGELVYGLVKEVGPDFVSYQRTDIPDGPIYTIPRSEVYVISYRNQVKDYINGSNGDQPPNIIQPHQKFIDYKNNDLFKSGVARIELGFLRSFTKVKDVKSYSSSASFPVVYLSYEVRFKSNINLGAQIGFGSHKFSNQQFSGYDSTQTDVSLKENIFGLYVYGRYYPVNNSSKLQPYIMAGLGITSSNIRSTNTITFVNDNSQGVIVKSGARSTGLGVEARIGAEYFLSKQLQLSLDAGYGLSVINAGLAVTIE